MNESCGIPTQTGLGETCHYRRISWSAILVGALVGIGISFLLHIFSMAIGLSIVRMDPAGIQSLAVGGFIGLLIGTVVAMYAGGFVAGCLGKSYCPKRNLGVLYGFTTWCVALVLVAFMAMPLGRYVSMYSRFIANPQGMVVSVPMGPKMMMPKMVQQDGAGPVNSAVVMNPMSTRSIHELGMGSLLVFVLFFVGALSSCFGGHYGMTCECVDKRDDVISKQ
jgi:hypothetical protein